MPLTHLARTPVDDWPLPAFCLFIVLYLLVGTATIAGLGIGATTLAKPVSGQWHQKTAWLRPNVPAPDGCLLMSAEAAATLRCLRTTLVE
jgi:hypothetical protein